MANWEDLSENEKQKAVDAIGLLLMLSIAVLITCIAVGLLFGVAWGFVAAAVFAIIEYLATSYKIRKKHKEMDDDE